MNKDKLSKIRNLLYNNSIIVQNENIKLQLLNNLLNQNGGGSLHP